MLNDDHSAQWFNHAVNPLDSCFLFTPHQQVLNIKFSCTPSVTEVQFSFAHKHNLITRHHKAGHPEHDTSAG